jgi:hypothetical protein
MTRRAACPIACPIALSRTPHLLPWAGMFCALSDATLWAVPTCVYLYVGVCS